MGLGHYANLLNLSTVICRGFPGGTVVNNSPPKAGDTREVGSISGSARYLEKEMATHCSILAWRLPWTEEPGGLQSRVTQVDTTEAT